MPSKCRSCPAEIRWAITEKGRRMPFDSFPSIDGTFALLPEYGVGNTPRAVHRSKLEDYRIDPEEVPGLYTPHHATCPNARRHRKK